MLIPRNAWRRRFGVVGLVVLAGSELLAVNVAIIPTADASLIGAAPDNSMGAVEFMITGTTQNWTTNRALMRFDVSSVVPPGARITGAKLTLACTRQAVESPAGVPFGVHRMLRGWGEGTNYYTAGPGLGAAASAGDATWHHAFAPTNAWATAGGAPGTDFVEAPSATVFIDSVGIFELERTIELIADVQGWVDHPTSNFGWMLKSESEGVNFAAKRIASREEPDLAPILEIDFVPAPRVVQPTISNGAFQFSFAADAGAIYAVEARSVLGGTNTWQTVTNFGFVVAATNLTARFATNLPQRFFRVRVD